MALVFVLSNSLPALKVFRRERRHTVKKGSKEDKRAEREREREKKKERERARARTEKEGEKKYREIEREKEREEERVCSYGYNSCDIILTCCHYWMLNGSAATYFTWLFT